MGALLAKGRYDISCMLKNAEKARQVNDRLLLDIIRENRSCEYGKKYGFADIRSVEDFKKKVPICTYRDIAPYIERMYENNEQNVLTSQKIIGYATSSGSVGKPKHIPRTNGDVRIYTKYTVTRFLALAKQYLRSQGRHMKPARGVCLLTRYDDLSPHGLPSTNVADIAAKKYFFLYPLILNLPLGKQFTSGEIDMKYACARFGLADEKCSFLFYVFAKGVAEYIEYIRDNYQMLADDIEHGTLNPDVYIRPDIRAALQKKLRPDPARAAAIRRECEKGFDKTILHRLWPNLSVISAIGTSPTFEGFTRTIQSYSEGVPFDFSIYGASEGLIAAAYEEDKPGQLLLTDSCYYEFIDPEDENAEHTLSLDELEVGHDYEIILTNRSGFYRYRFNDIIRVLDYYRGCPVINFVYRRGQLMNITGEKTNMEQMVAALSKLEEHTGKKIREWAVYVDKGDYQSRYALLAETEDGSDLSPYAEAFEEMLREVNSMYRFYEGNNLIDPPVILCQRKGTHDEWREARVRAGASVDQVKPVRILDTDEKKEFFLSRTVSAAESVT